MASDQGLGDDFLEQILAVPEAYGRTVVGDAAGVLQLGLRGGGGGGGGIPLGLNLEQSAFLTHHQDVNNQHQHQHLSLNNHYHNDNNTTSSSSSSLTDRESMQMRGLFPSFGQLHTPTHAPSVRPSLPPHAQPQLHHHHHQHHQTLQNQQPTPASTAHMQHPPGIRPRVRARRGQATDPHSIAERLRRERIAERMRALQELVPSINKSDRAAMLDEIVDYVKFLRLQVKVLSMSRLGGAGAVAQLVADVPLSAVEGEDIEGGPNEQAWSKWSNDGTEQQVAKLMEEDVGAAMQFLQSKALCIMPISLASAIFRMPQSEASTTIKPESDSQT